MKWLPPKGPSEYEESRWETFMALIVKSTSSVHLFAVVQHMHGITLFRRQVENTEVSRRILKDPVAYTPKFSKECKDICEGLMEKDPVKRLGFKNNNCEELKSQPFLKDINWGRLEAGGQRNNDTHKEVHLPY